MKTKNMTTLPCVVGLGRSHDTIENPPRVTRPHLPPVSMSSDYLGRQQARESNARTYSRRLPFTIAKARGCFITDVDGRVFLDCLAGAGTLALGHNHPVVVEALRRHLHDELPLHTLDLTTPTKDAFVEELFASLPPAFARHAKIQFCGPTGADAVE